VTPMSLISAELQRRPVVGLGVGEMQAAPAVTHGRAAHYTAGCLGRSSALPDHSRRSAAIYLRALR
jgi:hypothetical protein